MKSVRSNINVSVYNTISEVVYSSTSLIYQCSPETIALSVDKETSSGASAVYQAVHEENKKCKK